MSTRGRKKQNASTRVPPTAAVSAENSVSETLEPVTPVKRTTRSSSKLKTKKVPVNPKVKKKVPGKKKPVTTDDEEFEDLIDPEIDFEEPPVEIESEVESI